MAKQISEREQWFLNRIGKIVYRNKVSCPCGVCQKVYENGLHISDEMHASYVCECEGLSNYEGIPLRYFDTKDERDEYEKNLPTEEKTAE